jgi:predicted CXXCH cytochrome family protein
MKKVLVVFAAVSLMATAASAASIKGSKHDLSSLTGTGGLSNGANTQICIYCHAPHGAGRPELLWNRTNPAGSSFTLYQLVNAANTNNGAAGLTAGSSSLFCMSCHDGFTNMKAVIHTPVLNVLNATGGILEDGVINSSANLSSNLTTTHPINFRVNSNTQNDLFISATPSTATSMGGGAGTAATDFPLFNSSGVAGENNFLECGSCHAVHNSQFQPFLRTTLQSSTLCLGCHNK